MAASRYTDLDGGMWPDMPGDLIPNGGFYRGVDGLCDRPGTFRKRGGTYGTSSSVRGFRYLAANTPGTAGLEPRVMGVNVYKDSGNHYKAFIGQPSLIHTISDRTPHNNETYIGVMASNDSCGIYSAAAGSGGMSAVVNGNGQLSGTHNNDGSHHVGPTEMTLSEYTDTGESGHAASDHPGFGVGWAFFFPHPNAADSFAWMIGLGTDASVGVETSSLAGYNRTAQGSASQSGIANNFSPPAAGTLMTLGIIVGNDETISDDSLLLAGGWVKQIEDNSGVAGQGFTLYFYTKIATGSEGGSYNYPTAVFSATTKYGAFWSYINTPSDPTGHAYLITSGSVADSGDVLGTGSPGLVFTGTEHGAQGTYGATVMNYPSAATLAVTCGKPLNYLGVLVYPLKSKDRAANYPIIFGGVNLKTIVSNLAYEPSGDKSIVVTAGSQKITATGTAFLTNVDKGDIIIIRDDPTSPTYAYMGQVTKCDIDDTTLYVEPTPTVTGTYHTSGALKIAPAVLMEDHYGTSPLSSDIACAWQYRIVFAAPSPWNATSGVRGPTDYSRSICWTTLPGETVSNHTGLYLDGYQQGFRESIMTNNFLTVPEMAGPITAMIGLFATQLVVFGEHEIWAVTGDFVTNDDATTSTDTIQVFCQSKSIGCISKDSLVATTKGLVFASGDGVYRYDGNGATNLMHDRMANAFRDSIEAGATVVGSGVVRHNHYILSMSDKTYICNLDTLAWGELTNVEIFDAIDDPSDPSKTFGNLYGNVFTDPTTWDTFPGGQVVRLDTMFSPDSTNTEDADGTAVTATLITRSHNESDPELLKFYQQAVYEYKLEGTGTLTVSADTALEPSSAIFNTIGTLPQNVALAISGATNASPIVITTAAAHGYTTGDHVMIRNVGGNTNANGKYVVTVLSSTTFSLNNSEGNGSYTSGGTAKQDDSKAFNVKPKLKTGYAVAHKFVLSTATAQCEIRGMKHVFHPMRQGRAS